MRVPLADQQAVLDCPARVRVVRAAPGSGKTWLVAELIRRELDGWISTTGGIAALSFTRVGGDEIRSAVGHDLDHPHYVGTLDAFLFRYVVRPFLQKCFPILATPRLIPSEWGAEYWAHYGREQTTNAGKGINLFSCVYVGENESGAIVAHKPHPAQPLRPLEGEELKLVKLAKMDRWKRSGILTHSDAALWASKILSHETLGARIRGEIVRRFPLIIVDELQDTGYFLGKSIRYLLDEPEARGVLVGDPDQAIYEFNGARPDLFSAFESINGATTLLLSNSRRCPISVATTASHLKDSGGTIGADPRKTGRVFLIQYADMVTDVPRVVDAVKKVNKIANIKVIARQTSTVVALLGRSVNTAPRLGCPPLNHMHRAVVTLRQGRQTAALAAAQAALNLAVFGYEGIEEVEIKNNGIDANRWKELAVDCLLSANRETATGSLLEWQSKVGSLIEEKVAVFGLPSSLQIAAGTLKPQKRKDYDKDCGEYLPQNTPSAPTLSGVPIKTVHGVKGETHDVTIFVCPDTGAQYCPSAVWWSKDEKDREEKRIAYVAMTRTRGDLLVCVSDAVCQRLSKDRPLFVNSFEYMTANSYIAMLVGSEDDK